jgi:hypothetical protein
MAGFSLGPDDITTRLNDIIEHLESVALQERADPDRLATLLLRELNRLLLTLTPKPMTDDSGLINRAAQAGMDRSKLEGLRWRVRAGRADNLSGDRALALARFKQVRDYWATAAKGK